MQTCNLTCVAGGSGTASATVAPPSRSARSTARFSSGASPKPVTRNTQPSKQRPGEGGGSAGATLLGRRALLSPPSKAPQYMTLSSLDHIAKPQRPTCGTSARLAACGHCRADQRWRLVAGQVLGGHLLLLLTLLALPPPLELLPRCSGCSHRRLAGWCCRSALLLLLLPAPSALPAGCGRHSRSCGRGRHARPSCSSICTALAAAALAVSALAAAQLHTRVRAQVLRAREKRCAGVR